MPLQWPLAFTVNSTLAAQAPFTQAGAEAYTSLANAHFMAGHLEESEKLYRKALSFVPGFEQAKRNLEVVYRKAQAEGRLKQVPAPAKMPGPGELPFTGYEVAPKTRK